MTRVGLNDNCVCVGGGGLYTNVVVKMVGTSIIVCGAMLQVGRAYTRVGGAVTREKSPFWALPIN